MAHPETSFCEICTVVRAGRRGAWRSSRGAVWLARENLPLFWLVLRAVAWVAFTRAIVLRLLAAGASLALPEPPKQHWTDPLPIYTVLCPLRREAASVPGLVAALRNLDYPADRLDVKIHHRGRRRGDG